MQMSLLESIIYGFISGFSEFLPVSSQAHQALLRRLFGIDVRDPIRDLLVHLSVLSALIIGCWGLIVRLRRETRLAQRMRHRHLELRGVYDLRLVRAAAFPMIVGLLVYIASSSLETSYLFLALFAVVNGVILYIPEHLPHGNKDSRAMSAMDAILIGLSGILSALPGVSRVGSAVSLASARGADRQHALNWALLLSIPALVVFVLFDILTIVGMSSVGIAVPVIVGYIASAIGAFLGSYLSILTVRSLVVRTGFSGFAYYSWGVALFSLILYLIA